MSRHINYHFFSYINSVLISLILTTGVKEFLRERLLIECMKFQTFFFPLFRQGEAQNDFHYIFPSISIWFDGVSFFVLLCLPSFKIFHDFYTYCSSAKRALKDHTLHLQVIIESNFIYRELKIYIRNICLCHVQSCSSHDFCLGPLF